MTTKGYELFSFCPPPGNDKDKNSYTYGIQIANSLYQDTPLSVSMNPEQFEQFYLDVKALYENPRKQMWREL